MNTRLRLQVFSLALVMVLAAAPVMAGPAATDTSYFDGFTDSTGLDPARSVDVELDALGGVRLKGNAASSPTTWTTRADFETAITYKPMGWETTNPLLLLVSNPLIPLATLESADPAFPDSLVLPYSPLALRRVQAAPVLSASAPASVDGYGVGGMCVQRVNLEKNYYMWYTGVPEDGYAPLIYLATSDDGANWTREATPVLALGESGSFDSRQLGKPWVIYNSDPPAGAPKFKMWYSAEGDYGGSIGYATSDDGRNWTKWTQPVAVIDQAGDVGQYTSIAVGTDGLPVIAYYDATNGDLKIVHCGNASCTADNGIVTLDSAGDVGRWASLAIGADGLPVVSYYDVTNADLKVARCGTATCSAWNTTAAVDSAGDVGQFTSLAIGAGGFPVISYYDVTNGDLKLALCNDGACDGADEILSVVDTTGDTGRHSSLALASAGFPVIAYYDATAGDLRLVACNDAACSGSDEAPSTVDGAAADVGQYASLALASTGFPVVAYYDATNGDLKLVACNDAACAGGDEVPSVVDDDADDVGSYAALLLGADGLPIISYYDATDGDLLTVRCNDAACAGGDEIPVEADTSGDVGRYGDMAFGADGLPLISCYNATTGNLQAAPTDKRPQEVFGPGLIGSLDSFSVSHPSILYEGGIYRMWYTANDSNNRRIAYATSTDGTTWARGGLVFDLGSGNDSQGAWAPSVFRLGTDLAMMYTGWKVVAGNEIQSKLIYARSVDNGLTWGALNIGINPNAPFKDTNISQPNVLYDPEDATWPYKVWYVGNAVDANGNFHDRIGYSRGDNGRQWNDVASSGSLLGESLGLGAQSTAFDSMNVADLAPATEAGSPGILYGFYTGTNAADFRNRIGAKQSGDQGLTWTDIPALTAGAALIDSGAGAFDAGGVANPAPVDLGDRWAVYHTSLDANGNPVVGLHYVSYDFLAVTPVGGAVITPGTGFDSAGCADPSAVWDDTDIVHIYAGKDGTGLWSLGRATFALAAPEALVDRAQLNITPGPERYDLGGMRHPVVMFDTSIWRLWYTAIGEDRVERMAYAESADGATWEKKGLAVDRSIAPYDFAERGVGPAGAWQDAAGSLRLAATGVDRFGWRRVGLLSGSAEGRVDGGAATYQYPDDAALASAEALDWRQIIWNPAAAPEGTTQEIWVSYYPTYSGLWSQFFRIDNDVDLPFLLTVKGLRWQVRQSGHATDVAVTPQLDDLTADHAPIQFPTTGTAVTIPVGPPEGKYLLAWGDLTVTSDIPGGGSMTVALEDQDGTPLLAAQNVTQGTWSFSISGASLPVTTGKMILVFTLTPDTVPQPPETPLLRSIEVTYTSTDTPSSITIFADQNPIYTGQQVNVTGVLESRQQNDDGTETVTPLPGQTVTLKMRTVSETAWTVVGTAVTSSDPDPAVAGTFTFPANPYTPMESTIYRAEWAGVVDVFSDGTIYPPAVGSLLVEVNVPQVTLILASTPATSPDAPLRAGKRIVLSGSLTADMGSLAGQTVTIRKKTNDDADFVDFDPVLTLTTAADGTFTTGDLVIKPRENTEYQVSWTGGDALGTGIVFPETVTVAPVWVKPKLGLFVYNWASQSGKYYLYPLGSTVAVNGRVRPSHYLLGDGVTQGQVTINVYRYRAATRTWALVKSRVKALNARSSYRWAWTPAAAGRYRLQTSFAGDVDHQPALSAIRYVRIY